MGRQDLMGNAMPFGGKIMVFGGDFRQVLPVVPFASPEQVVAETMQYHYAWAKFAFLYHTNPAWQGYRDEFRICAQLEQALCRRNILQKKHLENNTT